MATTSPSHSAADERGRAVESVDGGEVEHEVGDHRADARADDLRGDVHAARRASVVPPSRRSASVTTGLKCAPETGPNARISATSPAPVAIEFSSSCSPMSSGESRCAAMPEPTTIATSSAVPTASALARRRRGRAPRASVSSSARPTRARCAQHIASASGVDSAQLAGRHLDVGEHGVDLPRLAVGAVDPDLVLHREATRDLVLGRGGEALAGEPALRGRDLVGRLDLDAEVVERAGLAVALDQHELQRRLGDGEVGVARPDLGRLGGEELRVEVDRRRRGRRRSGRAGHGTWDPP